MPETPEIKPSATGPIDPPPAAAAPLGNPSWKELQEFINKQTDRDRELIDKWFKLACSIIGVVFAIASIVIGIIGWKTINDAKTAAEEAARAAAKAKVAEVLQESSIKKLVEDTASDLFKSGAYRQLIQQQTQEQLRNMHIGPRLIDAQIDQAFRKRLSAFAGKTVGIERCPLDEPAAFAKSLEKTLSAAGLTVKISEQVCESSLAETIISSGNKELVTVLDDLVFQSTGLHGKMAFDANLFPSSTASIIITRRSQ
jgi:hypothetical protein